MFVNSNNENKYIYFTLIVNLFIGSCPPQRNVWEIHIWSSNLVNDVASSMAGGLLALMRYMVLVWQHGSLWYQEAIDGSARTEE